MRSSWPSSTCCPGWARSWHILPSARTLRVCSIVIASSRIKGALRSTCSPSEINSAVILPGMEARRPLRRRFRYLPRRIPGSGRLAGSGPGPSDRDGLPPESRWPIPVMMPAARVERGGFFTRSRICSLLAMKSSLRESISLPKIQAQAVVDRLFLLGRKLVEDLRNRLADQLFALLGAGGFANPALSCASPDEVLVLRPHEVDDQGALLVL